LVLKFLSSDRISYLFLKSSSINYNIDYVATNFPKDYSYKIWIAEIRKHRDTQEQCKEYTSSCLLLASWKY